MPANAITTYQLAQETGCSTELCKMALERTHNDADEAKYILSVWKGKSNENASNQFGTVCTFYDKDIKSAVVAEMKCDDEIFAGSKEFLNLTAEIVSEIAIYEHPYIHEPDIKKLNDEKKYNISFRSERFIKSSAHSLLTTYTHRNRIGVILETQVENPLLINDKAFKQFSFNCAMHIAAFAPLGVSRNDLPEEQRDTMVKQIEKELMRDGKEMKLWPIVIDGKINKWMEQRSLLDQIFIKSEKDTVNDVRKSLGEQIGTNVVIKRFARIEFGK